MNNHIKYKAFILSVIVILALSMVLAACTTDNTTDIESNEIIFDTNIMISEDLDVAVQYCVDFINGEYTINKVLDDNAWSYSKEQDVYYITAYCDEENAFNLILKLPNDDADLNRPLDYDKDCLKVIHLLNDVEHEVIKSPTSKELTDFVGVPNEASIDMSVNRYFIDNFSKAIAGNNSIESFLNNFVWQQNEDYYEYELCFDEAHKYIVSLKAGGNIKDRAIDYKKDEVIIKDIESGEEILNPSISELLLLMEKAQKDIEPDKYRLDDSILTVLMNYLDGSISLNNLVEQFEFKQNEGVYTKNICSVTHEYKISIKQNSGSADDYLDYEKVDITLESVSEGWTIDNPTRDNIDGIYETYEKLILDMSPSGVIYEQLSCYETSRVSLMDSDILDDLIELIDGKIVVDKVIAKYQFSRVDNLEYIKFYNDYDEYYLSIKAYEYDKKLDYGCCKVAITNLNNNWTIVNPTLMEIEKNILKPHKAGKPAPKMVEDLVLQKDNYIDVYMVNSFVKRIIIDDKLAEQFVKELKNPEKKMVLKDYKDTENEFHTCGIEIYLEDMGYDYPVPMWANNKGIKAIGWYNEEIPVSSFVYDKVVKLADNSTGWYQVPISEMHDIIAAELYYGDKLVGKTNNKDDMKKLNELLGTTMNMNGATKCPFDAKMILKRKDGCKIKVLLATDSCNVMVLGTSDYYMYGADKYSEEDESQKELLNIFGYESFFDIGKK